MPPAKRVDLYLGKFKYNNERTEAWICANECTHVWKWANQMNTFNLSTYLMLTRTIASAIFRSGGTIMSCKKLAPPNKHSTDWQPVFLQ